MIAKRNTCKARITHLVCLQDISDSTSSLQKQCHTKPLQPLHTRDTKLDLEASLDESESGMPLLMSQSQLFDVALCITLLHALGVTLIVTLSC